MMVNKKIAYKFRLKVLKKGTEVTKPTSSLICFTQYKTST